MYYNRKKEIKKNSIIITFILLLAIVSTYYIYHKFEGARNVDYNSDSLEVVFHEIDGNEVKITKVTPVTDSVGLSSHAYTFTIKNNLTQPVSYKIKLIDDLEKIVEDECGEYQISKQFIKVSIKEDKKENKIFTLQNLKDEVILDTKIKELAEKNYTVRVWVDKDSNLPTGTDLHYHGEIQVEEENNSVALNKE